MKFTDIDIEKLNLSNVNDFTDLFLKYLCGNVKLSKKHM